MLADPESEEDAEEAEDTGDETEDEDQREGSSSADPSVQTHAQIDQTEFDFTLLQTAKAGINAQTVARALVELEAVGPKVKEVADLLKSAWELTEDEDVERANKVKANFDALIVELMQLTLKPAQPNKAMSAPQQRAVTPPVPSSKRTWDKTETLPLSPEKSQKRHQSYSIH